MSPLHRARQLVALAVLVVGVCTACGDDPAPVADGSTAPATSVPAESSVPADGEVYSFIIPAGTGERIDAGEDVEVLPARLDVRLGDQIVIDNQDEKDHIIGPFFVAADQTMEHTFVAAGSFAGACSAHSAGEILVVVT